MSLEIDVQSGDAAWPVAKPLLDSVWPPDVVAGLPWGHLVFGHPDLRVLVDTPDGLVCHVGITFRSVVWKGRKWSVGGIGGVATRADQRRRGYASAALAAAIQTLRDHEAIDFGLLFCEADTIPFYETRGWRRFVGNVRIDQPGGAIDLTAMTPLTFDLKRAPREGAIDLCGLPW